MQSKRKAVKALEVPFIHPFASRPRAEVEQTVGIPEYQHKLNNFYKNSMERDEDLTN